MAAGFLAIAANGAQVYEHGMTMVTPAAGWWEALPSGNGTVGALLYGNINEDRVLFNHNELWYKGNTTDIPDVSAELPVVRKLLDEGKYLEANSHYKNALKEKGYKGTNGVYHPAFDLILRKKLGEMFENYSRTLDFETGEAKVTWTEGERTFSRKLFVSIPDNVSVMAVGADKAGAVDGEVTLDIHDLGDALKQNGERYNPGFTYTTNVDGNLIEFRADGSDGGEFGGVARVVVNGGEWKDSGNGSITFKGADSVNIVIGFFANEPSDMAVPRLKKELGDLGADYDQLFARHSPMHAERFNSMDIVLNPDGKNDTPNELLLLEAYQGNVSTELLQKLFDYGRYLLISSSRAGGYPANLQGIWNGDYSPPWKSLYGNNENLQMNYWQGLPGNMQESMMAFFDYFDANLEDFRYNAKQLYGADGIYMPPFMSPESGRLRITSPHVIYWTDAAGWMASFYNDYYLFTGDEKFLEKRAVPFMKEVALFYEDFIVKDENGKNRFYPSQSPENQPKDKQIVDPKTGRKTSVKVQINATVTVAIAKEVLMNLVAACELLDIEKEGVVRWKALLADMPEYEINEDGAIKEWLHKDFKDNYEHRHQSHIYPLFPGHELSEETHPELYEACKVAIEKRLAIGLKDQTGWSLAHMANINARLGEGEKALNALEILSRSCLGQNFFTYHNDWRKMGVTVDIRWGRTSPFQMDANFGISAAVTEMLCSSSVDMLKILPALPAEWEKGEINRVQTRVGAEAVFHWDIPAKKITVKLTAGRDNEFTLKLPDGVSGFNSNLDDQITASSFGENYRTIRLEKGQTLEMNLEM
ncbi:MAG: glycoside hydrolase family 95 protein [Luteolibacter sp.]